MSRKGSLLERNVKRMFDLSGIRASINKVIKGYEIDVYVNYNGFQVALECKQYERSTLAVRNLIHQWDSKNKELRFDSIILVLIGIDVLTKDDELASKYGIRIWDESKFEKLFDTSIQFQVDSKIGLLKEIGYRILEENKTEVDQETEPEKKYSLFGNLETFLSFKDKIDQINESPYVSFSDNYFPSTWMSRDDFYQYYGSYLEKYNVDILSEQEFKILVDRGIPKNNNEELVSILISLLSDISWHRYETLMNMYAEPNKFEKRMLLEISRFFVKDTDYAVSNAAAFGVGEWGSIGDAEYLIDLLKTSESKEALLALLKLDYKGYLLWVEQFLKSIEDLKIKEEIQSLIELNRDEINSK